MFVISIALLVNSLDMDKDIHLSLSWSFDTIFSCGHRFMFVPPAFLLLVDYGGESLSETFLHVSHFRTQNIPC